MANPDPPPSDYPFKISDTFHRIITPLVLKIPIQWLVTILKTFDQVWVAFGISTVDLMVVFSRR